ncbi:hypothetical protein [Herbiconiux ginsengi]|uniref:hypothetical protein n=1 Tax=Herbiconiux ginsengi TaxID=381665 RepID=UPI0015873D96|nr:hypothetical protein [Herbiconiux ginsengi]
MRDVERLGVIGGDAESAGPAMSITELAAVLGVHVSMRPLFAPRPQMPSMSR